MYINSPVLDFPTFFYVHNIIVYSTNKKVPKVRPFLELSCGILRSVKIVVIFNPALAEIKAKSADVLL